MRICRIVFLHEGIGELACCGQPMKLLEEKTEDVGQEKYVPLIEKTKSGIKIKVGTLPHPMESDHYIEWIEVITGEKVYRKFCFFENKLTDEFKIKSDVIGNVIAREYCNIHGLWKTK